MLGQCSGGVLFWTFKRRFVSGWSMNDHSHCFGGDLHVHRGVPQPKKDRIAVWLLEPGQVRDQQHVGRAGGLSTVHFCEGSSVRRVTQFAPLSAVMLTQRVGSAAGAFGTLCAAHPRLGLRRTYRGYLAQRASRRRMRARRDNLERIHRVLQRPMRDKDFHQTLFQCLLDARRASEQWQRYKPPYGHPTWRHHVVLLTPAPPTAEDLLPDRPPPER